MPVPYLEGAIWEEAPEAPIYNLARVLAANTAESFTVPDNCQAAIFSASSGLGDYWIDFTHNTAAVIPVADNTTGTCPSLNPAYVKGLTPGKTISVISANAGIIVMHCYGK